MVILDELQKVSYTCKKLGYENFVGSNQSVDFIAGTHCWKVCIVLKFFVLIYDYNL